MKQRSDKQAAAATKSSVASIKKAREEQRILFGLGLHKKFLQVAAADQEGNLLTDKRVKNDLGIIEQAFSAFPKKMPNMCWNYHLCGIVHGQKLAGNSDLETVLPNPCLARLIAKSKKKTDRFGYMVLATSSCLIFLIF